MRKPIIAGNWKMHKTVPEAVDACRTIDEQLKQTKVEAVICAPFTALSPLAALGMENTVLGSQNMFWAKAGAYTGEISATMLKDVGCNYVIVGHSERREHFHEDDALVNKKGLAALQAGLRPIICVGETLAQREQGETDGVVVRQVQQALASMEAGQMAEVVIAYEPVWAIGTGRTATADDANQVIGLIRQTVDKLFNAQAAGLIRIQYGGSVKPDNAVEIMAQPEIDGALVGGASLEPEDFLQIIQAAV